MKRLNHRGLKPELLGLASLNFSAPEDSSARQEMIGSHLPQALVIDGATIRRCLTGVERIFGTATFNIKMPCDGEVKAIVEKYPRVEGQDAIQMNPHTSIIVENIGKGQLDLLELPHHHCKHNHYGFKYQLTDQGEALTTRKSLPKGTILADSPNIDKHGNYKLGVELNTAFMSIPGTIEDGVVISESTITKLTATGYEKRSGSWGRRRYPLNLYGDDTHYKPFPDIGETIREDGLLFAFREYDELLAGVEMATDQLKRVDHVFDRRVYGVPKGKVVDVIARRGSMSQKPRTPVGMETQAAKYHQAQIQYYDELQRVVDNMKHRRSGLTITPRLHRLLVEGLVFKNDLAKNRPKQMYNLQELDEWRVDITFEYKVRPNVGSKLTGLHGNRKAVN